MVKTAQMKMDVELNNKDSINLLNKEHTATIYKPEPYYYDPRV